MATATDVSRRLKLLAADSLRSDWLSVRISLISPLGTLPEAVDAINELRRALDAAISRADELTSSRLRKEAKKLSILVRGLIVADGDSLRDLSERTGDESEGVRWAQEIIAKVQVKFRDQIDELIADLKVRRDEYKRAIKNESTAEPVKPNAADPVKLNAATVATFARGKLEIGDDTLAFEGQEELVLQALVELRAATKVELETKSGVSDAVAILKRIIRKHQQLQPFITLPGGRGKGGYRTTISAIHNSHQ